MDLSVALALGGRAQQALVTVVATSYLLGISTRRAEKLAEQLGVKYLSKSQVSDMAGQLDAQVKAHAQAEGAQGGADHRASGEMTVVLRGV